MYFSNKIVLMPNEAAASRCAPKIDSTNSSGLWTILIPCKRKQSEYIYVHVSVYVCVYIYIVSTEFSTNFPKSGLTHTLAALRSSVIRINLTDDKFYFFLKLMEKAYIYVFFYAMKFLFVVLLEIKDHISC